MIGGAPDLKVVALGGGHGLHASLSARRITANLTAIVTVADDGGSSGRLRRELGVLPPGDLRMALAALCGDDEWGQTWERVVQHRFRSEGELHGHAVGNLDRGALGIDGRPREGAGLGWPVLGAQGRVLPMVLAPLDIHAEVELDGVISTVHGQVACVLTSGRVRSISLVPPNPPVSPEAIQAIHDADWVVFGPGLRFTSGAAHLKVPELAKALHSTSARRLVILNLAPQVGETAGFSPQEHLEALRMHAPSLRIDAVLADASVVEDLVRAGRKPRRPSALVWFWAMCGLRTVPPVTMVPALPRFWTRFSVSGPRLAGAANQVCGAQRSKSRLA